MKKLSIALLLTTSTYGAEVIIQECLPRAVIEKIEFDGHTYIHYLHAWKNEDSAFFHDPSCECGILTQKRIKDVREIMRIWEKDKQEQE